MYPTDLPTPTDVRDDGPGCPSCGSQWGHPDTAHGAPGDRSLAGLLCSVALVQRLVTGSDWDHVDVVVEGDEVADLLGQALARFHGDDLT